MAANTARADCGHEYPKPTESGASGYAIRRDPETGREATICYPCAEVVERVEMLTADRWTAYISRDGRALTTWTGGELASVASIGQPSCGTTGHPSPTCRCRGSARHYGRATTPDGAAWSFMAPYGLGGLAHLRRLKAAKAAAA